MHDLKALRDDRKAFDAALIRRGLAPQADALLALDTRRRALLTQIQVDQARRNEASKAIGAARGRGDHAGAEALMAEVAALKTRLPELEAEERSVGEALDAALAALPNLPDPRVPDGADESGNVEQHRWGTPRKFAFAPRDHADLAPALGIEFETAARMSGARFTFLRGDVARLNRALGAFMLDHARQAGFEECAPPLLVRDEALFGTGQLPKFGEDLFRAGDDHWLIPTAEVSLTNSVREQILDEGALPLKLTALTPCFRSEAGAAGRDTRGLIRQHQFDKVELVAITRPEDSDAMHHQMVATAEGVLDTLGLPYRRMLLCAGDMSFTARMTYDLEVWLPGQDCYREISSLSNCGDFQARRMNARYRPAAAKGTAFVHTLNGSSLAVGRTLVAVIENYQEADGSVTIPAALRPYLGGMERLEPRG